MLHLLTLLSGIFLFFASLFCVMVSGVSVFQLELSVLAIYVPVTGMVAFLVFAFCREDSQRVNRAAAIVAGLLLIASVADYVRMRNVPDRVASLPVHEALILGLLCVLCMHLLRLRRLKNYATSPSPSPHS